MTTNNMRSWVLKWLGSHAGFCVYGGKFENTLFYEERIHVENEVCWCIVRQKEVFYKRKKESVFQLGLLF